jgi:heme oxygenase (mycobilin-producing)
MFVALSQFTVVEGMEHKVKDAFVSRPHLVEKAPGFERMEVLRPQDVPEDFWLLTWWQDEASYQNWHKSHEYHQSHKFMPEGLKLVPSKTKISFFERIST